MKAPDGPDGPAGPDVVVTDTADGTAVAIAGDRIVWVGPQSDAPPCRRRWSAGGRLVTPGLIDCHTHLVFGGDRADEWEQRLAGASYEELAASGGGIRATVAATRAAATAELRASAAHRLRILAAGGVTTVEVKSGYGLDLETELRMLRVARALVDDAPVDVVTTFLGAHTVPPELDGDADGYITAVCEEILPAVAAEGLADAVDAFCEAIAFTPAQVERVFTAAAGHGLPVKLHADQLTDGGGAALAARHRAISADHLDHASVEGIAALAASGTVAVLLPGATHCLQEASRPPVADLRAAGVPMAVATDANPGTSPVLSLVLAMHLACVLHGLTPAEALAGATTHAAAALGLRGEAGVLAPGARADLAVWDVERPVELVYWVGADPCHLVIKRGLLPSS